MLSSSRRNHPPSTGDGIRLTGHLTHFQRFRCLFPLTSGDCTRKHRHHLPFGGNMHRTSNGAAALAFSMALGLLASPALSKSDEDATTYQINAAHDGHV